jgi:hypothetical protein
MFNLFPQKKSVDEILEDAGTTRWASLYQEVVDKNNELLKEVLKLRHLKEENVELIDEIAKLKKDIENYVFEKDDEIEKLKKENLELIERVNEIDNDVIRDLKDEIFVLENDYAVLKAQKHPMYPLHWMGLDPLIHEQARNLTIEQAIDKVKQKTPWVEEPIDWKGKTTAENLEEKFDKGEDVVDYFKPYHCPCNMCKHAREENTEKSWEEAASDLALRVVKLEKQIEELKIVNICQKPF